VAAISISSTIHSRNVASFDNGKQNAIPAIDNDDAIHEQTKHIPSWAGGWSGSVHVWKELGKDTNSTIRNVIVDRDLRFIAINSGWRLEIYEFSKALAPGKQLFDSKKDHIGVKGCAWIKEGLVIWGNNRFSTPKEVDEFGGDITTALREARRIWLWQYAKPGVLQEIGKESLSSAATDGAGQNVLLFGRGGRVKEILPEGKPKGSEVAVGRLELLSIDNQSIKQLNLIEEWGIRSTDAQQYPFVVQWNSEGTVFFVDDREQIIKVESPISRKSKFARVLMMMDLRGTPLALTDMDKKVLVYPNAPITALEDGKTICCTVCDSVGSFAEKQWMSYYDKDGLIKEINVFNNQAMPTLAPYAYTPDGSGIMLHYYEEEPTSGKQHNLLVWNHSTSKSYRIGLSYPIYWVFPFVKNSYLPFVSRKKTVTGDEILLPGIIEIHKDLEQEVYEWKGLEPYLAESKQ